MRVLICEDEPDIADILGSFLRSEGFDVSVASDGPELIDAFSATLPDLVLLDVLLPTMTGWQVLAELRQRAATPIIMITALGRVEDTVRGLSSGADDFITKPFSLDEVRARIDAVLRRTRVRPVPAKLEIDDALKEVTVRGLRVHLSPKEYGLLRLLASRPGEVVSDKEILAALWQGQPFATAQDVQKYIYLLRRKLESDPKNPELILTARGFGYRLLI